MCQFANGDLSDLNNCRAISISTAMSKYFETTISDSINNNTAAVDYQFGFKPGQFTGICTNVFKQVGNNYTDGGSYVFACL